MDRNFLDPGKYTCLGSKPRKEMGTKIEFLFALAFGPKSWLYRDTILIACNVYFLIFDLFLGFVSNKNISKFLKVINMVFGFLKTYQRNTSVHFFIISCLKKYMLKHMFLLSSHFGSIEGTSGCLLFICTFFFNFTCVKNSLLVKHDF